MVVRHCALLRQDRACSMSFTVSDFNDFKQLLALHPEWQVELRRMIVGNDLEALPSLVRDLIEAHQRAEQRLTRLEGAISQLEGAVGRLAEAQQRAEDRLSHGIDKLMEAVELGQNRLARLEDKSGGMEGQLLEMRYRDRTAAYFGRWLRKTRVVDPSDLSDELEKHLSSEELNYAMEIDLVVRGRPRQRPDLARRRDLGSCRSRGCRPRNQAHRFDPQGRPPGIARRGGQGFHRRRRVQCHRTQCAALEERRRPALGRGPRSMDQVRPDAFPASRNARSYWSRSNTNGPN